MPPARPEKGAGQRECLSCRKMKLARQFIISGRVQGVGFRFFAERVANQLGIRGYVKNRWDGTVEVYAIGDADSLEEFKRYLTEGPRSGHVKGIEESDEPVRKEYSTFRIEDGW
jgi:acylphosphatase